MGVGHNIVYYVIVYNVHLWNTLKEKVTSCIIWKKNINNHSISKRSKLSCFISSDWHCLSVHCYDSLVFTVKGPGALGVSRCFTGLPVLCERGLWGQYTLCNKGPVGLILASKSKLNIYIKIKFSSLKMQMNAVMM